MATIEGSGAPAAAAVSEVDMLTAEVARLQRRLPAYSNRLLWILMAVAAVEAADRTILSTVMEDVKHAFGVSDTQLGLLTSAYAVLAALSVLPFGILTDRVRRVKLIAYGLIPWTLAMAWTGAATSFAMMFVARMFLGSVEATAGPSTPSLLGDYYPVERRSRVFGVFGIGQLVGALLGFAVAGILSSLFGWRSSFFIWGGMGAVMMVVVLAWLPEPVRGLPDALHGCTEKLARLRRAAASDGPPEPVIVEPGIDYRALSNSQAARQVARIPTLWIVYVAGAIGEMLLSGLSIWAPTFFRRYHGASAAGGGSITALLAVGMVAGIVLGGRIGDRYLTEGRPRSRVMLAGWAHVACGLSLVPAFGIASLPLAVPFFLAGGFFLGLPQAPLRAIEIDVLVPHLRGRASSLRSLLRVAVTALAPLLFGFLSDGLSLRAAFMIMAPTMALSGLVTFLAAATYERDMAAAQRHAHRQYLLEEGERVHE